MKQLGDSSYYSRQIRCWSDAAYSYTGKLSPKCGDDNLTCGADQLLTATALQLGRRFGRRCYVNAMVWPTLAGWAQPACSKTSVA